MKLVTDRVDFHRTLSGGKMYIIDERKVMFSKANEFTQKLRHKCRFLRVLDTEMYMMYHESRVRKRMFHNPFRRVRYKMQIQIELSDENKNKR